MCECKRQAKFEQLEARHLPELKQIAGNSREQVRQGGAEIVDGPRNCHQRAANGAVGRDTLRWERGARVRPIEN